MPIPVRGPGLGLGRGDRGGRRTQPQQAASPEAATREVLRHIDPGSVFKVSLAFYLLGLVVVVLAGFLLWNLAEAFGTIKSIDKSVKTLFDLKSFTLHPLVVLGVTVAGGLVLALVGSILNSIAAALYNLISDVVGGLRVDFGPRGRRGGQG